MTEEFNRTALDQKEAISDATFLLWRSVAVNVPTVALLTGISEQGIYRLVRSTGEVLPGVAALKVGRRYLVPTGPLRRALMCDLEPAWIGGEALSGS